jgi:hypothetical protein
VESNYLKYRGKCKEYSEKLVESNPDLVLIRGYYYCPIWNKKEQHWWCKDIEGNVVDPTKLQFPSAGCGDYEEFTGIVECSNCGKSLPEEEASFESNYCFCSYKCHGQFIGIL